MLFVNSMLEKPLSNDFDEKFKTIKYISLDK